MPIASYISSSKPLCQSWIEFERTFLLRAITKRIDSINDNYKSVIFVLVSRRIFVIFFVQKSIKRSQLQTRNNSKELEPVTFLLGSKVENRTFTYPPV